jgi:hypothetical protein
LFVLSQKSLEEADQKDVFVLAKLSKERSRSSSTNANLLIKRDVDICSSMYGKIDRFFPFGISGRSFRGNMKNGRKNWNDQRDRFIVMWHDERVAGLRRSGIRSHSCF